MNDLTIGFIGGGNMATSLIHGLIADGINPLNLWVSDIDAGKLDELKSKLNINTSTDNREVIEHSSVAVLAVKPQVLRDVAEQIGESVQRRKPVLLSIAAGIRESSIQSWLGNPGVPLVRCMPNTPALVQSGATALHAGSHVDESQRDIAESIMRAVGITIWTKDEKQLDVVTALSGSGPAYFFLLMETLEEAAQSLGLDTQSARLLTQQTALGAAKLAMEAEQSPADLRKQVTSPGGTTQHAMETFEAGGFRQLVKDAVVAAHNRSIELSDNLGRK